MRYRLLVAMPFVAVAALWAALALVPAARHTTLYGVEVELAKCAALVGCAVAATRFGRGDYLRTAWLLFGQCYLFILGNDIFLRAGLGIVADRPWAPLTSSIVIFVANLGQLVGVTMIALLFGASPASSWPARRRCDWRCASAPSSSPSSPPAT